jgi:hypothetical protein
MTSLTERAERATTGEAPADPVPNAVAVTEPFIPAPDPMADYEPGEEDPDMVPVNVAWLRVRRDIRAIGKGELYNQSGTKFNFRGVDTVVNVFGPVTLKHGVHVLPLKTEAVYSDKTAKSGSKMRECCVTVTWLIMGPRGDTLTLQTMGEALDLADKATTKAQSVALRTLLLSSGLTPTHDADPDTSYIERGEAPVRSPESYRDEMLEKKTSPDRLNQIRIELDGLRMLNAQVQNETGALETLDSIGGRMYKERTGGGEA